MTNPLDPPHFLLLLLKTSMEVSPLLEYSLEHKPLRALPTYLVHLKPLPQTIMLIKELTPLELLELVLLKWCQPLYFPCLSAKPRTRPELSVEMHIQ